jgi:hypothetical protein
LVREKFALEPFGRKRGLDVEVGRRREHGEREKGTSGPQR